MKLMRKLTLVVAMGVFGMTIAIAKDGLAADVKWKMATSWGGGPLMEIGAKAFAEKVAFLTEVDGAKKNEVKPAGDEAKPDEDKANAKAEKKDDKGEMSCGEGACGGAGGCGAHKGDHKDEKKAVHADGEGEKAEGEKAEGEKAEGEKAEEDKT